MFASFLFDNKQVNIEENVYSDGFGWKFLVDATLTATRIGEDQSKKVQFACFSTCNTSIKNTTGATVQRDSTRTGIATILGESLLLISRF